ncbi:MAG: peptidase M50 [Planctomycetota bacterium]|nr:MAG: peptidase M50 [Planctomycetota bacterium]
MDPIVNGLVFYTVFVYSTSFHEAAHAWAALKGGDSTAYDGGQVTLDPRPHIQREPIGMVVMPLISLLVAGWPLGFASAPYNTDWASRHPDRAGWMALAGPGANLLLVLLAAVAINIGLSAGVFTWSKQVEFADVTAAVAGTQSMWHSVGYLLGTVFSMNLLLALFNLLPLPPLDGSAAVVLLLPENKKRAFQNFLWANPQIGLFGLFVGWKVFHSLFRPAFNYALNALYFLHDVSYT